MVGIEDAALDLCENAVLICLSIWLGGQTPTNLGRKESQELNTTRPPPQSAGIEVASFGLPSAQIYHNGAKS
jgi:hypothetical protein